MGKKWHLSAFGLKIVSQVTPHNKINIATAYEEMALLLRMMNRFREAKEALTTAENIVDNLLLSDRSNKEILRIKSLILFRQGEVAQVTGEPSRAKNLYQKSLAIDNKIGDNKDRHLIDRLISEVSV